MGEFGLPAEKHVMDPRWNKVYVNSHGHSSVYLTPSIEHAAHPRYALPWQKTGDSRNRWFQLVFQCRVNAKSNTFRNFTE